MLDFREDPRLNSRAYAEQQVEHFQRIVTELTKHANTVPATLLYYQQRLAEAEQRLEMWKGDRTLQDGPGAPKGAQE